jgi:Glycosyltransferase family 87
VRPTPASDRAFVGAGRIQRAVVKITTFRPELDGRILATGMVATYLSIVAVPRLFWGINIWPKLGVPAAPTLFFDTRVVTAGLECRRMGFDPLRYNPCDPLGRTLNYPRTWLLLRYLGLNQSHTDALAVVFIALFLSSVLLLVGRISLGEGVLLGLALCSPSVMFGVERGNVDIVMFALVALAVIVWRTRAEAGDVASPVVVLVAATMKIYPVFGLPGYLFGRRRRAAFTALACAAAFAVYAFIFRADLQAMARATPQGQYNSFGVRILPAAIYHHLVPQKWRGGAIVKQLLAIVPLMIGVPVVWRLGRRKLLQTDPGEAGWHRLAFFVGSLVFLGSFALGNNWDYRLVFVLLMLPQLFEWIADPSPDPRGPLAGITTISILVLLWIGALSKPLALSDEVVTWATVGLLLGLLSASIASGREIWDTVIGRQRHVWASGPR